jgi:hypothetical protein
MAHFAKLNENSVVMEVNVVGSEYLLDANGVEREELGVAFLVQWSGGHPYWKQTSYNANFRKNYAGIGYTYDEDRDSFIPPKPYASWLLDEDTCFWIAPVPYPEDGKRYAWNEQTLSWDEITQE